MSDPAAVRKQLPALRPGDLERFPIWEQALDEVGVPGQDEETVKPRPDLAEADRVVFTPTLIVRIGDAVARVVGDLVDVSAITNVLTMGGLEKKP